MVRPEITAKTVIEAAVRGLDREFSFSLALASVNQNPLPSFESDLEWKIKVSRCRTSLMAAEPSSAFIA